jgi:hypothetical protein
MVPREEMVIPFLDGTQEDGLVRLLSENSGKTVTK